MNIPGAHLIHWRHPNRKAAACNRNLPAWCESGNVNAELGMRHRVNCMRCRKLMDSYMNKQLAKIQMEQK